MASRIGLILLGAFLIFGAAASQAQDLPVDQQRPPVAAPTRHIQSDTLPVLDTTPQFDAAQATEQYLSRISPAARQKSDDYFEGGYVLQFVDLIYGLVIAGLLLWLQISARIRDWAEERTHSRTFQIMLYAAVYMAVVTLATLPLSIYEGFIREHDFGLSNQTFVQWGSDFATGFAISLVSALIALPIIYAAIRAARQTWWLWAAGIAVVFLVIGIVIAPVAIEPLFNHYSPLADSPLKQDILSLARANGIPADNVWLVDASRQSNRISANVSGLFGTTRIALNDNLLKQCTHDEILAVLGHEMGHYVMNHIMTMVMMLGLLAVLMFGLVALSFSVATDLFGGNWQVRQPDDIAGLPLLVALISIFMYLSTPLTNSIIRTNEQQADVFGVNAVRKPDAFANVVLKLSSYRKLNPGPWEEIVFYDHPSGRTRIATMMRWKNEHLRDLDIRDTLANNPR